MDCPTEEGLVRRALESIEGVGSLEVDLVQRTIRIEHSDSAGALIESALLALNLGARRMDAGAQGEHENLRKRVERIRLWIAGGLALASEIVDLFAGSSSAYAYWFVCALALLAIALGGFETYKKGIVALTNRRLNMNALMSVAVTGALCIGQWPEAAMVMVLFSLAENIEARSMEKAHDAVATLLQLAPVKAFVRIREGEWVERDLEEIETGSVIRVKPGERIPLDGSVVEGESVVNQAPITGESLPVEKRSGDTVYAGTVNGAGLLHVRTTKASCDTTLAHIIRTVENSQKNRAPIERFVDRFAAVYTPLVFLLALCVAVFPPLVVGGAWLDWLYRALVLLVIACPCALVISTPVSIVSGIAAAAHRGILIKGGAFLELGAGLDKLALDKTGTLTTGKPHVMGWSGMTGGQDDMRVSAIAVSLASRSTHPVSRAITEWGQEHGVVPLEVSEFSERIGKGVVGTVEGNKYFLVSYSAACQEDLTSDLDQSLLETIQCHLSKGESAVALASSTGVIRVFYVADLLKKHSAGAVKDLHALGIETVLLSGDNADVVRSVAESVNITNYVGGLLPEEKVAEIEKAISRGSRIGMVGDGINDAPALTKATIGFSMGAVGSDVAIESSDVSIMDDDIRKLPEFIKLARRTMSILKQNIVIALGIKLIFISFAFMGISTMWMAVFADIGTTLIVTFNGLRLLKS